MNPSTNIPMIPFAFRISRMDATARDHIVSSINAIHEANKKRQELEKLLRDNGFKVNICKGELDPRMATLFPNHGINILEEAVKLLAANPWQDDIKWCVTNNRLGTEPTAWKTMSQAASACEQITSLLCTTTHSFSKIAPQPSEDEIAAFQAEASLEDSDEGIYSLTSSGMIGSHGEKPPPTILVRYLLHIPRVTFPRKTGETTWVRTRSLVTAVALRDKMKSMMEKALIADQEREDRRKK